METLKNGSILLLLLCVLTMGVWVRKLSAEHDQMSSEIESLRNNLRKEKQEDQTLKVRLQADEAELQKAKDFFNQKAHSEQRSLEAIKHQYNAEYETLMRFKQEIETLKDSGNKASTSGQKDQIKNNQELIASLENQLKELSSGEKDLGSEEKSVLKNKDQEVKEAQNNLNIQIREIEAAIKDTRNQIAFWRKRRTDINQATKLKGYEATLSEQNQLRQNLQNQKLEISSGARTASEYIASKAKAEKDNLKDSEAQIRDRIARAKDEVKRLQEQVQGIDKENNTARAQLQKAESQYQQQLSKVKSVLENYQKEKQALEQTQKNPVAK